LDSGNGLRLRLSGKQTIAFYWRANHGDNNWAELAPNTTAISPEVRLSPYYSVIANWMAQQIAISARQCAIHKHDGEPGKPWPIVSFGSPSELESFLASYRNLRAKALT